MAELHYLLIFMIIGSIAAINMKGLLSSVILLGAVSLGITMAFIFLRAPDLAITQLVIEIIAIVILIRATVRLDQSPKPTPREFAAILFSWIFVCLFLMVFALPALRDLPRFGEPLMNTSKTYLQSGLAKTGSANIVTAVMLDYRGLDRLIGICILFASLVGVLTVIRTIGRKKRGEPLPKEYYDDRF
jgi:multisubunit Na+/H+ antiporter MnhB subunit